MGIIYGDLFLNEGLLFSKEEIEQLKSFKNHIIKSISDLKNKKKKPELKNKTKSSFHKFTKEEENMIEKVTRDVVRDTNIIIAKDTELQNKIKESAKKFDIVLKKIPKFIMDPFESSDTEIILIVLDEDQMIRVALNGITYDIAEKVEKILNDKGIKVNVDIGDGDEGCIYIQSSIKENID